jgi:predicted dehydrogenase
VRPRTDRRAFLAGSLALGFARSAQAEELPVAVVGLGERGRAHLQALRRVPGVRVVALCDADEAALTRVAREGEAGGRPALYGDFRHLFAREDVAAVVLATPDHWHALMTIQACLAGTDVFVESPATHSFLEGERVLHFARSTGRIVQCGFQARSSPGLRAALAFLRAGELGVPRFLHGVCFHPRASIGRVRGNQRIPETVDYDLWCGPAPLAPLRRERLHGDWRWAWATGNGELGARGAHVLDLARAALGSDALPLSITSVGGRYALADDGETPNTQFVYYEFEPAPLLVELRGLPRDAQARLGGWAAGMDQLEGLSEGVLVECEGGSLRLSCAGSAAAFDRSGRELRRWDGGGDVLGNWLEALRTRRVEELDCELETGLRSSALVQLGQASLRVGATRTSSEVQAELEPSHRLSEAFGRMRLHLVANGLVLDELRFTLGPCLVPDPSANCFRDHERANALLAGKHREPYVLPLPG